MSEFVYHDLIYQDEVYKIVKNFISPQDCIDIIQHAEKQKFYPSALGISKSLNDQFRKSETVWVDPKELPIIQHLYDKIENMVQIDQKYFESLQIVKYGIGGFFRPHYDVLSTLSRLYTIIIYLNDDYENGHTHFPFYHLDIKLNKGDALLFRSVDFINNKFILNKKSLHQGKPITQGTKYICNIWISPPVHITKTPEEIES